MVEKTTQGALAENEKEKKKEKKKRKKKYFQPTHPIQKKNCLPCNQKHRFFLCVCALDRGFIIHQNFCNGSL